MYLAIDRKIADLKAVIESRREELDRMLDQLFELTEKRKKWKTF